MDCIGVAETLHGVRGETDIVFIGSKIRAFGRAQESRLSCKTAQYVVVPKVHSVL